MPHQDDEELDDQPEKPGMVGKVARDFMGALEARKLGKDKERRKYDVHLQACAEDELVKKEYKEMVSLFLVN